MRRRRYKVSHCVLAVQPLYAPVTGVSHCSSKTASTSCKARKKAIGASVTNVSVTPDDTLEGYPDAYTYRLDGNDGIVMDVKIKVSTTNGDARVKATINMRRILTGMNILPASQKF